METAKKGLISERLIWELQRAFFVMRRSPLPLILLLQAGGYVFVAAKGAGPVYMDMLPLLLVISILSWTGLSLLRGNQVILTCVLILLTVGTMLQCIFLQEAACRDPAFYGGRVPASGLQMQYLTAFICACLAAFAYRRFSGAASVRSGRILYAASLALSACALVFSAATGGVRNWIHIGGLSVQTTEIMKISYVLLAAILLGTREDPGGERIRAFFAVTASFLFTLVLQGEFGTLLLLLAVFLTFLFLFVPDLRVFLATTLGLGLSIGLLVTAGNRLMHVCSTGGKGTANVFTRTFLRHYSKIFNRFAYWLHPEKDPLGLGYQLLRARESIVLGGWFGTASVTDLPVKTSDLVYPALICRCGMVFAILVFFIYIFMWLEGVRIAARKKDRFHRITAAGFVFLLFYQVLIIISGSTGLCPLTGITLPFISSGGTSLTVCAVMTALTLAVSGNVSWKGADLDEKTEFFEESAVAAKCHAGLSYIHAHLAGKNIGTAARHLRKSGPGEKPGQGKSKPKRIYKGKHSRPGWGKAGLFR